MRARPSPVVPEAPLERTEHGLVPAGDGWYARDARWGDRAGRAHAAWPEYQTTRDPPGLLPGA